MGVIDILTLGIGLAITQYLLHEGHNVVVMARTKSPLDELKSRHPKQVRVLTGDMADLSIAKRAADLARKEFGQVDGLIINHAVFPPATKIADSKVEDWKHHFDINLFSAIALVRSPNRRMRNRTYTATGPRDLTSSP